jgi:hypothetical protein
MPTYLLIFHMELTLISAMATVMKTDWLLDENNNRFNEE